MIFKLNMKSVNLCLLGMLAVGATSGAQHVVNPEFETVGANGIAPGWERAGDVFSVRKGEGFNGTCGLVYENDDPGRYRFPFQKIDLKPGRRYLVTAMIRTENIRGKDIGAGVCVEFTAGGAYSKGFKGTTDGWVKVAFTSDIPVRATAESIVVAPFVRRGCTGKAWFDEIHVVDLGRPPVETLTSSAYRDCAAEGTVAFVSSLNLEDVEGWKGSFSVRTSAGSRTLSPEKFTADCAAVRLPVEDLPVGVSEIRFRLADVRGKTVAEKSLRFERLAVGADRRRVRFDAQRRTLVDGKPFFPLGIYIDPRDASCVDVIAKSPFNCVLPGEAREEPGLYDACRARGLMVVGNVGGYYADIGRQSEFASVAEAEKALVARVEALRGHPALLAWYAADEFPSHLAGVLEERRQLLGRLDPDHPTYAVTCHPEELRHMLGAYEVAGSDPYPIGFDGRDREIAEAARWARLTRKELFGLRPVWQVPQIFNWIAHRPNASGTRAPTYEEMRSMVWQAIAEGANGIFCYAFMSLKWAAKHDPFEKRWSEVCRVADEVRSHAKGLLSDERPPKLGPLPEGLSARGWTREGVKTVVLVNQRTTQLTGTLSVDGTPVAFDLKPLAVEFR